MASGTGSALKQQYFVRKTYLVSLCKAQNWELYANGGLCESKSKVLFEFMFVTLDYRKRFLAWLFLSVW